jgi:hypothetical protein
LDEAIYKCEEHKGRVVRENEGAGVDLILWKNAGQPNRKSECIHSKIFINWRLM